MGSSASVMQALIGRDAHFSWANLLLCFLVCFMQYLSICIQNAVILYPAGWLTCCLIHASMSSYNLYMLMLLWSTDSHTLSLQLGLPLPCFPITSHVFTFFIILSAPILTLYAYLRSPSLIFISYYLSSRPFLFIFMLHSLTLLTLLPSPKVMLSHISGT